ncbi:MAG: transporter ATP-binding protein [Verrucomicrobiales bacterium]|nr:transporter ATP-binding protein [Verrucomicrobiales bacterium]
MGTSLLRLREITKDFESQSSAHGLAILKGVSIDVTSGESLAIVGPSGSGKSTLLNIMGTLDRPSGGSVFLNDIDLTSLDERQVAQVRNEQIGFIFQSHHLLPQCTVLENVLVPTLPNKSGNAQAAEDRANKLLERVGLGSRRSHRPGQLSGGEKQRVAVVRALINRPKLLLADEPSGALDRASADQLAKLLVEMNVEEGVALIVVTHALDLAQRMKTIYELHDGVLIRGTNR